MRKNKVPRTRRGGSLDRGLELELMPSTKNIENQFFKNIIKRREKQELERAYKINKYLLRDDLYLRIAIGE